jgi:hypothetical protein
MLQSKESIGVAAAFAFSGILISIYQVSKAGKHVSGTGDTAVPAVVSMQCQPWFVQVYSSDMQTFRVLRRYYVTCAAIQSQCFR